MPRIIVVAAMGVYSPQGVKRMYRVCYKRPGGKLLKSCDTRLETKTFTFIALITGIFMYLIKSNLT